MVNVFLKGYIKVYYILFSSIGEVPQTNKLPFQFANIFSVMYLR